MFHFPTFPPLTLCVQVRVTGHDSCRVSPFGNPRITARLAASRGLSQPPTSFIGSWCQGIHRAPLLTWPQRCSRPLCSSQATDGPGSRSAACPPLRAGRSAQAGPMREAGPPREWCRPPHGAAPEPRVAVRIRSFRTQQRAWATADPTGRSGRSRADDERRREGLY
jgi:hypothetical protein